MRALAVIGLAFLATPAFAADLTGIPRIVDGDTIEIAETKIRLEGIDAPETDQLCLDAKGARWACGVTARDELVRHTAGKRWSCKVSGQDRYGRSLGTCFIFQGISRAESNGKRTSPIEIEDVNRWMVLSGWALAFVRYSKDYVEEDKIAQDARAGLWAGSFIAPWDWRGRNTKTVVLGAASVPVNAQKVLLGSASASAAPDKACTIKGNMTRAGECIFHVEGGKFYAKVNMDLSKGRRWFCTEAEAEAAGCRRSKL